MPLSPHAYVEYECEPIKREEKWVSHKHLVPLGDGRICVLDIEEAAELLAEAVRACNPDKQEGHGYTHLPDEPEKAYREAIRQLLTTDFEAEHRELMRRAYVNKRWGGQAPAAVLFPDQADPREWKMLVPDKTGTPFVYNVREKTIQEAIPPPEPDKAVPDKEGISWRIRRKENLENKLRRLMRRG